MSRIPAANTKAPTDETRLSQSQPSPPGKVKMRRGMPSRPVRCIGTKVTLKPTNVSQNAQRPSRSESWRPVTAGK